MSDIIGYINKNVVAFSGDETTREFIGVPVRIVNAGGALAYQIDGTFFHFTPEEFKVLVRERVVDHPRAAKLNVFGIPEQFYEESRFFKGAVEFEMETPRHAAVLDFTEGVTETLTGAFERIRPALKKDAPSAAACETA